MTPRRCRRRLNIRVFPEMTLSVTVTLPPLQDATAAAILPIVGQAAARDDHDASPVLRPSHKVRHAAVAQGEPARVDGEATAGVDVGISPVMLVSLSVRSPPVMAKRSQPPIIGPSNRAVAAFDHDARRDGGQRPLWTCWLFAGRTIVSKAPAPATQSR